MVQDYHDCPIPDFPVFLAAKEVIDPVLANELKEGVGWGAPETSFAGSDFPFFMFFVP